ncbi:hypothetical protein [Dictyobacter formicarum]|uniref:Uncharacterized protein n=1 Tax=Dictyobacter formicarum TaxID=2778368 RepID=A0ABQ3VQD1_9CHLR|nr:hypothetical protein [Dictyobacter formicarum]GHO87581.1 hypothetical protein KSZ_55870 [Dictyobacter formicarum]
MSRTVRISVEHVVVSSKLPYQQVIDTLEALLGTIEGSVAKNKREKKWSVSGPYQSS